MYRVESVLVARDGSAASAQAQRFAASLGDGDGPALRAVHAVPPLTEPMRQVLFPYAALGPDDRAFESEMIAAASQLLKTQAPTTQAPDEDAPASGVDLSSLEVFLGPAHEVILEAAQTGEADLIAMGLFGESGASAAGLGSTSRRVVSSASRPVALIRDFGGAPKVKRLLVALELSKDSPQVLQVAAALASQWGATVDMIHVVAAPTADDPHGWMAGQLGRPEEEIFEAIKPRARALLADLVEGLDVPPAYRGDVEAAMGTQEVVIGDPGLTITERVYDGAYDLVVVGRGQGRPAGSAPALGRVASTVITGAPAHVVVVPPRHRQTPLARWGGIDW